MKKGISYHLQATKSGLKETKQNKKQTGAAEFLTNSECEYVQLNSPTITVRYLLI